MTIFLPRISWASALSSSRVAKTVPRPVAASRPHDPCRYTGLPVTTAGEKPDKNQNCNRNWNWAPKLPTKQYIGSSGHDQAVRLRCQLKGGVEADWASAPSTAGQHAACSLRSCTSSPANLEYSSKNLHITGFTVTNFGVHSTAAWLAGR